MNYSKLQQAVFICFLVLIVGLFLMFQILGYDIDFENISQYLKNFGILAPLIFIIIYTLGTFFIPSTPFMIAAGILFGFKYGLLYTVISGFFSSTIVFYTSRKLGKEWVEKVLQHRYLKPIQKYNQRLESGGVWDLVILRIMPVMPFNALNILMGISRIKIKNYIAGTLLGLIPSNVLTVYIGAFITRIL